MSSNPRVTGLNSRVKSLYLLTLFPAEAVVIKKWKSKTRGYHQTKRTNFLPNCHFISIRIHCACPTFRFIFMDLFF